MNSRFILAAMLLILGPFQANIMAQTFVSGTQLHEWCTSSEDDVEAHASCAAYIMGVFDENSSAGRHGYDEFQFCISGEISTQQLVEIVSAHLETFPQTLATPANALIHAALFNAFPCNPENSAN